MKLRFTKMHGLGNDFVMIDSISQHAVITPERARRLADRNFGVGCDQVLVVEPPERPDADFRYRIFNADGSEVENCGNGARCFAIFVRQRKLTGKRIIRAETAKGVLTLHVLDNESVRVDMGAPITSPASIPFQTDAESVQYELDLSGGDNLPGLPSSLTISAISMGNPHAVTVVDDVNAFAVDEVGPIVENHPRFPERVNAGFMEVRDRCNIALRVYERGSGETLACGTGACAAVVSGILRGLLDNVVTVALPGGKLNISWQGGKHPVMMTGPVTTVFHGQTKL